MAASPRTPDLAVVESERSRREAAERAEERRANHKAGLGFQTDKELEASGVLPRVQPPLGRRRGTANVYDGRVLFAHYAPMFTAWVEQKLRQCWIAAGKPVRPSHSSDSRCSGGTPADGATMKMYLGTNSMFLYGQIASALDPFPVGMSGPLITVEEAMARVGRFRSGAAALYIYRRDVLDARNKLMPPAQGEFDDLKAGHSPFLWIEPG